MKLVFELITFDFYKIYIHLSLYKQEDNQEPQPNLYYFQFFIIRSEIEIFCHYFYFINNIHKFSYMLKCFL